MKIVSALYAGLKWHNDARAVGRAVSSGSSGPIWRRLGRRAYGKATGRLAGRLFG
jgi:hypothetical protein